MFQTNQQKKPQEKMTHGICRCGFSVLLQLVRTAHLSHLQLAVLHTAAGPGEVHVEVHAVDPGAGVVLDAQVNVLLSGSEKHLASRNQTLQLKICAKWEFQWEHQL